MSFSVSSLPDYIDQLSDVVKLPTIIESPTVALLDSVGSVMYGVKYQEALHLLTSSPFIQTDDCGLTASGSEAYTDRTLTVAGLAIKESLCPKTLNTKWLGQKLRKGSTYTELGFVEEFLVKGEKAKLGEYNEKAVWQGWTGSADTQLNKVNGFLSWVTGSASQLIIPAEMGQITGSINQTNIIESLVSGSNVQIPAQIRHASDFRIFVSQETADQIQAELFSKNIYNPVAPQLLPGTSYKYEIVPGLNGTNRAFAARLENMVIGTDGIQEAEKFAFYYDPITDLIYKSAAWKLGTQLYKPTEAFVFQLA